MECGQRDHASHESHRDAGSASGVASMATSSIIGKSPVRRMRTAGPIDADFSA